MTDIAIRVENLSKQYRVGQQRERYKTLRYTLTDAMYAPFRRLSQFINGQSAIGNQQSNNTIWALKDVSFEVNRGEVVGIIGRNGAGKSTLLKILTRITEPTEGNAEIHGRVGSLLEVGTGFHSELTGRENTYLNGAILGMKKAEIDRKFDEIVAFAEIEKFIDTPVKHYSSGMYVRLAFAVAAHLESEILLVDEVLAVGDVAFQKKCLGKMEDVVKEGRTVLFVSHNMAAIQRLCNSAILLRSGRMSACGTASKVIQLYLQEGVASSQCWERSLSPTSGVYFQRVYLSDETGKEIECVTTASSLKIVMEYVVKRRCRNLQISVDLLDSNGDLIFASNPQDIDLEPPDQPGKYRAVVCLPPEILLPKLYGIRTNLWVPWDGTLDCVDSLRFSVQEVASLSNNVPEGKPGQLVVRCDWSIERSHR